MAARRFVVEVPAGSKSQQRIPWALDDRAGSFEWSVVVHAGEVCNVRVSASLRPAGLGRQGRSVVLEDKKDLTTTRGSLTPSKDDRLLEKTMGGTTERGDVELIIFDIKNTSWLTSKKVEIVTLDALPPGPPPSKVKELPCLPPQEPLPQGRQLAEEASSEARGALPQLHQTCHPASSSASAAQTRGRRLVVSALDAQLDAWLAFAETHASEAVVGVEWIGELRERVLALREGLGGGVDPATLSDLSNGMRNGGRSDVRTCGGDHAGAEGGGGQAAAGDGAARAQEATVDGANVDSLGTAAVGWVKAVEGTPDPRYASEGHAA